jgi:zinc transporter
LVWAFRIHSDGVPEALAVDQPIPFSHDGLLWLHFNLADARALQWLTPPTSTFRAAGALLLSKDNYQQLHTVDDCVYGVISDLLARRREATEDTGYLRFVMTEQILVSGRHHALCAVDATRRALEAGHRIESAAALLETIVEHVADYHGRHCRSRGAGPRRGRGKGAVGQRADQRQNLGRLRRTCARLHRQLSGLRIVFHRFEQKHLDDLKPPCGSAPASSPSASMASNHTIVEMRERSRLLQEELHLKIEEQGNDNIRVLSVLTALLMPPTLVTGIFGMNTKGLPFTDLETAFLWASLLLVLSSLAAYFIMKRIGLSDSLVTGRDHADAQVARIGVAAACVVRRRGEHKRIRRRQGRKCRRMAGPEMVQRMA